ncbi:MAG TPA: 2-amino-4-hydroxy-6-hydroxymethyldihydropteridine diphosphokinase [Bacteroidales bacterium]|nr:2-amino-4-hydroxy-6-hydroxymethyldihydropteridine diphosphokinase [Bacteroidales bacterium]HQO07642.1 2-amino-4-hydroxy-6-hydroxymethyldihydropteridine diphosphokinase [Bacteroidales bacterium]HQP53993.1 2-amino-4-hydroxy-6-hydroxymethyldihydropteridine diphosphokinase [Bacteroidales bacterium]
MQKSYLLLGSNLGDKNHNLLKARTLIQSKEITLVRESAIYKTSPWGFDADEDFLNQVVEIATELDPMKLLNRLLEIEKQVGRKRKEIAGYQSRILDVDILFFGSQVINTPKIIIPHPRLHLRRFTLVPMNELAPDLMHPVLNKTIAQLLAECDDNMKVVRIFTSTK